MKLGDSDGGRSGRRLSLAGTDASSGRQFWRDGIGSLLHHHVVVDVVVPSAARRFFRETSTALSRHFRQRNLHLSTDDAAFVVILRFVGVRVITFYQLLAAADVKNAIRRKTRLFHDNANFRFGRLSFWMSAFERRQRQRVFASGLEAVLSLVDAKRESLFESRNAQQLGIADEQMRFIADHSRDGRDGSRCCRSC